LRRTFQSQGIIDCNSGAITFIFDNNSVLSFDFSEEEGCIKIGSVALPIFHRGEISDWLQLEQDGSVSVVIEMPISPLRDEIYGNKIKSVQLFDEAEFGLQKVIIGFDAIECLMTISEELELYTTWKIKR
jgi:hypothetical protein